MNSLAALAGVVVVISAIFILLAVLVGIAFYVFYSLMLYRLAKKEFIDHAWLAWIPYASQYLLGQIAGPMNLFGKIRIEKTGLVLLLAPLAVWAATLVLSLFATIPFPLLAIPFAIITVLLSWVGPIAILVLELCVLYRIYSPYLPKNTVLVYTLVSIIGVTVPFFIFSILKKEPISEPYDFTFQGA
ncbi:MAG TPA: hypothetical protein IAC74_06955 [Candidatus Aphodoplasma excrementigallinarum]|uniref:Uncharacterized protein n=1 Tax=Candidatus Aphodoplasma excrementigallinarum TaxID=2840673 RepID=A0A9D1NHN0_9FIRM|nr:hypothetical protein [Candidatus Aphodoplasma excrementigallinarum]